MFKSRPQCQFHMKNATFYRVYPFRHLANTVYSLRIKESELFSYRWRITCTPDEMWLSFPGKKKFIPPKKNAFYFVEKTIVFRRLPIESNLSRHGRGLSELVWGTV